MDAMQTFSLPSGGMGIVVVDDAGEWFIAQDRRVLLLQAQAVPRRREPVRQTRVHLPGHRRRRVDPDLAARSRPMIYGNALELQPGLRSCHTGGSLRVSANGRETPFCKLRLCRCWLLLRLPHSPRPFWRCLPLSRLSWLRWLSASNPPRLPVSKSRQKTRPDAQTGVQALCAGG